MLKAVYRYECALKMPMQTDSSCFGIIQAPEGIHCVSKRFPALKIVTSEIDVALNEEFRVIPGMGEFGDRYFGTDD